MPLTQDEMNDITYKLHKINTEGKKLTKWEEEFVDSVGEQFSQRRYLSERQMEILNRIYDEKT